MLTDTTRTAHPTGARIRITGKMQVLRRNNQQLQHRERLLVLHRNAGRRTAHRRTMPAGHDREDIHQGHLRGKNRMPVTRSARPPERILRPQHLARGRRNQLVPGPGTTGHDDGGTEPLLRIHVLPPLLRNLRERTVRLHAVTHSISFYPTQSHHTPQDRIK